MRYLIDTSALVRVMRRQVSSHWYEQVARGLVAICEPVLTEALTIAGANDFDEIEAELTALYPWVAVPDDAWDQVRELRRALAKHSAHRALSVADYLVVATGRRAKLTVLHEDKDFELVGRVFPEFRQQRISSAPATDEQ
jgi:predicted nucleic acid-binding protein